MVEIRPARETDVERIAEVYVETWRDSYAGVVPDHVLVGMSPARQATGWTRAIRRNAEIVMVAEDETDGVVGVGSAGGNRDRQSIYKGEVYTLYVAADHQNQGVGRQLLAGLFGVLKERGCEGAVIWVLASNPARFFYEAVGGIRAGERDEKLWGVTLHEIAYAWPDLAQALDQDGLARRKRGA